MRRRLAASFVASVLLAFGAAQGSPIGYAVSYQQGGEQLTGRITTDGTLGNVHLANIIGWSFTQTGSHSLSISSTDAGAFTVCSSNDLSSAIECGLTATPDELGFDFTHKHSDLAFRVPATSHSNSFVGFSSNLTAPGGPPGYFQTIAPDLSRQFYCVPCSSDTIATAVAAQGVPETGSMALAGMGLAGCFLGGQGGQRCRQAAGCSTRTLDCMEPLAAAAVVALSATESGLEMQLPLASLER